MNRLPETDAGPEGTVQEQERRSDAPPPAATPAKEDDETAPPERKPTPCPALHDEGGQD